MDYPDRYIRRVVITVAIIGAAYLAWQVKAVLMIVFGGMIIATLLTALANVIGRFAPFNRKVNVGISVLLIVLLFLTTSWWIGGNIADQLEELQEKLPRAIDASLNWLQQFPLAPDMLSQQDGLEQMDVPLARLAGITGTALGAIANIVLILAIGLYLAATPELYHRGLLSLVPPVYHRRADTAFISAAKGLQQWLVGQLVTMVAVGILFAIGLHFLDIPLALSLGLIAGLLEFIPFIGPFLFGVLAVMLAFMEGPTSALHVAILCIVIQQIEGNLITPLVQRRAVALPPVLGLVGVLIFGGLFGVFGILFATPLMVVVMILVQKLYVQYGLESERSAKDQVPPHSEEEPSDQGPSAKDRGPQPKMKT